MAWLERVAEPVLEAMAEDRLTRDLPGVEGREARVGFAAAEAFCRTLCGVAPWLELSAVPAEEAERQARLRQLAGRALGVGLDPAAADRLEYGVPGQPLVEAAFLGHALRRAPSLWAGLDHAQRQTLVAALSRSRLTTPPLSNWVLFSAMVEAALARCGASVDWLRIRNAVALHEQWYVGDGTYGDGPKLHHDYYNS